MAENFQFISRIGQGAFASVYKVMRKEDSNFYAFKKIKATHMKDKQLSNCLNQVRILASVKSPYIIAYKEAFYQSNLKSFCLITQFAEGGDLSNKIHKIKKSLDVFQEKYIWRVGIQLLQGIKALHALNIFHRDIKPANILLSKNDEVAKLGDMNVSIITKNGLATTQTGTPYYASPQVWMQKPYSGKSDIWSLGCVLYQMAAQKPPFSANDLPGLKKRITTSQCDRIPSIYSNDLDNFIKKCLVKDQKFRLDSNDLLQSNLLKQKMKMFPNQKFSFQETINQNKSIMIQTIRFDTKNFKSLQNKLPKCAYQSCQKENINKNILQNNSWVLPKKNRQNTLQKIPKLRAESAKRKLPALKIAKEQKPPLKRNIIKMR